jgi:serine/threonine-protein kinase
MLYEFFVKAISLSKHDQKSYLIEIKQSHPESFDELLTMIKDDETSKNMDTHYWSSLMASESSSIIDANQDLAGIIISSFKLTELIDKGGMGSVYKAQRCDEQFEQTVAIKILHSELEKIIGEHALIREAGFMAKLTHPNIGKVFDAGVSDAGYHFIVMEYIDGCSITEKFKDESLTQSAKLKLFCDLCDAVNHAHQMQVIHADLKPANILITQDNQVKILDFGISRMFNSRSSDSSAAYTSYLNAMTASYASPELLSGERACMYSDIYALGKMFSLLFTQQKTEKNSHQIELEAIVKKATAQIQADRYPSVLELKNDINRFMSGHIAKAYRAPFFYRIKKFTLTRHPISVLTSLITIGIFSTLMTNFIIQYHDLKNEKYQTDLMLEKFSLVLDLDLNAKSAIEIALAVNYESRSENEKAMILYQGIISRVESLSNTNIAFDAGHKLLKLLIKTQQLDLINNTLSKLNNKIQFHPQTELPITASQAIFYRSFMSFINEPENNNREIQRHKKLVNDIKENYWHQLSAQQKAEISFITHPDDVSQKTSLYYGVFQDVTNKTSLLDSLTSNAIKYTDFKLNDLNLLPQANSLNAFLESATIFFASTHKSYFTYEDINQAIFSSGVIRVKENSGIYTVHDNVLRMNFGGGLGSDNFIYISSLFALSVPSDGDLSILAHNNFLNENSNNSWNKKELLDSDWYHIYDDSVSANESVKPSMVKISFQNTNAHFMKNNQIIDGQWSINKEYLTLKALNSNQAPIQLIKSLSDEKIILVKDANSMLPSLFVKDKALAEFITQYWQNLLKEIMTK